jgi:hypothetical protein
MLKFFAKLCGYDKAVETLIDSFRVGHPHRVVFVSSSVGDDANDGLSEETPKRTIVSALAISDINAILFRQGDTFRAMGPLIKRMIIRTYRTNEHHGER